MIRRPLQQGHASPVASDPLQRVAAPYAIEKEVRSRPPLPFWRSLLFVHPLSPTHSQPGEKAGPRHAYNGSKKNSVP